MNPDAPYLTVAAHMFPTAAVLAAIAIVSWLAVRAWERRTP